MSDSMISKSNKPNHSRFSSQWLSSNDDFVATPRRQLLLVDDDDNVRHAIRRELEVEDYKIFEACDAETALQILEKNTIDMVISDQRMPVMSGFKLLERVRHLYPKTIRILISGYTDFSGLVAAINDANITAFINKPWDESELRELIRNQLSERRKGRSFKPQVNTPGA